MKRFLMLAMLLQDKETKSAHTLLKESPSKITGSFGREKTVGSSKKSGALKAFLLDKEPCCVLMTQPKTRMLPESAPRLWYRLPSGTQRRIYMRIRNSRSLFLTVGFAFDSADQYQPCIGYYGNETFLHSINPKFLFFTKVSKILLKEGFICFMP